MPRLSEREILERDAARDLNAELLESIADIHAGNVRVTVMPEQTRSLVLVPHSPEVVEYFKAAGAGWQTRMDEALKEWIKTHPARLPG